MKKSKLTILAILMMLSFSLAWGQVGSSCQDPMIMTLPVVDYADNTETYGNNYTIDMIDPESDYLDGNDFVVQFTLAEDSVFEGSVVGTWTGLMIVDQEPSAETPAPSFAVDGGSSGGAISELALSAGTYYAIVSTWPTPDFTDFTLNLSATAVSEEVLPAILVSPVDAAEEIDVNLTLAWISDVAGVTPTGYNLNLGTDNPPTNILTGEDLGDVTSYDITELDYSTTYYWQVVPYSEAGNVADCPIWSFTTMDDPTITDFPYTEDFVDYLPLNWTEAKGLLAEAVEFTGTTAAWADDEFANAGENLAARLNIYGTLRKEWLMTPPIDLGDGSQNYQLLFDLALTDYDNSNPITDDPEGTTGIDDKFAVVISTDNGVTWSSANTLMLWDNDDTTEGMIYNEISHLGQSVVIDLSEYSGIVRLAFYGESTLSNADNDLFVDNVTIEVDDTEPELPAVFFSEYIEGSSNNKAIEIYNNSGETVDLANFRINQSNNGGDWQYIHDFPAGSTLADGDVWVIMTDQVDPELYAAADADEVMGYPSPVHHNGNDARALEYSADGESWVMLDVIGIPTSEEYWDVAGVTEGTKDHTLVRKDAVTEGNTDWAISAGTNADDSEWIVLEQDTFENLGWHIDNPATNGSITGTVTLAVTGDVTTATVTAGGITVNPATDGTYSIEISAGTYDVVASCSGFTTVTESGVVVEESTATENINFTLEESLEMPQPVDVTVDAVTGTMSWFPPAGEGSQGWIGWSAEENNDGIGMTGGGTFSVASRWDTENIAAYHGMTLSKISFFPNEATGRTSFVVKVWTGDEAENLVAEQDVTPVMGEWNEVELDNPVTINAYEDLWFGYTVVDHADGEFPAGTDAGPAVVGYGDMISMDGSSWDALSDLSPDLNYNWNIKGFVEAPNSRTIPMTFVEDDFDNVARRDAADLVQGNFERATGTTREVLGYNVYLDGDLVAENISDLSYTFGELEVDVEYLAAVEAIFADAVSEPVEVSFTFAGTLDVPTDLAVDVTTGMVTWGEPGAGGPGGAILEEGFENGIPETWTTIDNDGDGFNWESVPEGNATHSGTGAVWSLSYDNATFTALTPDNYLITPQLTLDTTSELSFWVIAQDQDWADEQYFVKVSTSGTNVADFETVFEEVVGAGDWRQVTVDLSSYAGQSVYIAFNHAEVTDMFAMNIDDVVVTGAGSRDFTGAYNVYKNDVLVAENITEQSFQLTSLLVGSEYTVGVTAIHDAGESAASELTFTYTGVEEVLPVEDLAVNETSGELSWNEPAPPIDYSDDFEAYTAGEYLAEVADIWTTWAQNPGGSDDALISDAQANSGVNSVHVEGNSDLVLPLGNKTSGTYEFSMMMYLEPGNGGYYNIQHYQTPGEEWGAEFYFGDDGNGEYSAGYPEAQPFTHPTGEWFEVKNVIDLDAAEATFLVNDTEVASWDFGLTAQGEAGINQLGGINIYSGAITGQTPNFYFDDVNVFKVTDRPVLSYDVYLDDTLVGNTTETSFMLEDLTNGEAYTAGVIAIFESGESEITEIDFTYNGTSSEDDLVLTTALNGNYPNPFNPTTTISFSLAEKANVDLKVYNAKGQVVKTLVAGEMEANNHTVVWNGSDNSGKAVSSGVYFYRLSTKGFSSTQKMMLIK